MKKLLPFLGLFFFQVFLNGQSIERMEPPNWWLNMKHHDVQIMFYGDDLGSLIPSTNYEGVQIKGVEKVANQNYLFVNISISESAKPGQVNSPLKEIKRRN